MFTDRYLRLPTQLYNREQEEVHGLKVKDCETLDIEVRINPFKIASYRPGISCNSEFEPNGFDCVKLTMDNGDAYEIRLSIEEFEKRLNSFNP